MKSFCKICGRETAHRDYAEIVDRQTAGQTHYGCLRCTPELQMSIHKRIDALVKIWARELYKRERSLPAASIDAIWIDGERAAYKRGLQILRESMQPPYTSLHIRNACVFLSGFAESARRQLVPATFSSRDNRQARIDSEAEQLLDLRRQLQALGNL